MNVSIHMKFWLDKISYQKVIKGKVNFFQIKVTLITSEVMHLAWKFKCSQF